MSGWEHIRYQLLGGGHHPDVADGGQNGTSIADTQNAGPDPADCAHGVITRHSANPGATWQAIRDGTEACEVPDELRAVLGIAGWTTSTTKIDGPRTQTT